MDLSTLEGVQTYLAYTPFASSEIIQLVGGLGNYTFRVRLAEPYHGRSTVVLKHGKPYIPGMTSFAFSLDRQKFEVEAMRRVRVLLPADSLATTPEVYLFDEEAAAIIMEDCGEDGLTLKDLLIRDGTIPESLAGTIGTALGLFLARVHTSGTSDAGILEFFDKNAQAKPLSAWLTYGRLVSTLSGQDQLPKLADPPLDVPQEQLDIVAQVAEWTTQAIQTSKETFLHGDFWPGNIMVRLKKDGGESVVEKIYVVDWELTKVGLAGLDVGQFCAEMNQARRFYPDSTGAASAMLENFLSAYRQEREGVDHLQIARVALRHVGAHLVAWTPRVPWGEKEKTREVVLEGVGCLVAGQKEDGDIAHSIVGPLCESTGRV